MPTDNAKSRTRRLGRGLSSLIESSPVVSISVGSATDTDTPHAPTEAADLKHIATDAFDPSPFQARESFDEAAIEQLAVSIRHSGLMQPVMARPRPGGRFELVAGERRWRAARAAGLSTIPAIVRDLSDEESAELGVTENVQREDLNPIERAHAFAMLAKRFGMTHAQIGERVGIDRSSVANCVRLLDLEDELQDFVADGRLSQGHAKVLLGVSGGARRVSLARRAVEESWTVRRLERVVADAIGHPPGAGAASAGDISSDLADLEHQLSEYFGTRVRIRPDQTRVRGRIELAFYDLDHFDGLLGRMGFRVR